MSSDLQSAVAEMQFYNNVALATVAAIIYDYVLTFPQEIDYVWNRSWTLVSSMFIIVRYIGMAVFVIEVLLGSSFMPGPAVVSTALLLIAVWGFVLFLAAADLVMILRVYAMYNQSKIVLGVLLFFYVSTIALYSVSAGYYNNPNTYLSMDVVQLLDMSFCNPSYSHPSTKLGVYKAIPRLTLAGLLFLLVVGRVCWDLYQGYKTTKRWRINRYMDLLVKEGIIYFVAHIMYNINFGDTDAGVITTSILFILIYVLSPRFIMNVRELHVRSVLWTSASFGGPGAPWDRRDVGIDTGFGISKIRVPQLQLADVDSEVVTDSVLHTPSFVVAGSESFGISEAEHPSEQDIEMQAFHGRAGTR